MEQVMEGGTYGFMVVAKNKFGTVVPVSDAAVALSDSALGSATVPGDGKACSFVANTGVTGTEVMTPSAGGVTGEPFSLPVVPDTVVASVSIQPLAPATVEVVPAAPAPVSGQPQ